MSNLGWYQVITKAAKNVGGPKKFIGALIGVGVVGTLGFQKIFKLYRKTHYVKSIKYLEDGRIFKIFSEYNDNNGLHLLPGDSYKILSRDEQAIMIEKIDDNKNPYFISEETLKLISDFGKDVKNG